MQNAIMTSGAIVLAVAGALAVAWALCWDRARGRKRCPKCGYDMGAAAASGDETRQEYACPECGERVRGQRALGHTRRRWGVVWLVGALALTAWWAPGAAKRAMKRGVVGLAPTTALVVLVPRLERGEGPLFSEWADELRTRCEKGDMEAWQLRVLCERVLALRCRARVPVGAPVLARRMDRAPWLLGAIVFQYRSELGLAEPGYLAQTVRLGEAPKGMHGVTVRVQAETVGGECACELERRLEVRAVEDAAEAVTLLTSPELDARVLRAMTLSLRALAGTGLQSALAIQIDCGEDLELAVIAFPVAVLLQHNGEIVASFRTMLGGEDVFRSVDCVLQIHPEAVSAEGRTGWTAMVRGDPESALEDPVCEKVWSGEIEVPVNVAAGAI